MKFTQDATAEMADALIERGTQEADDERVKVVRIAYCREELGATGVRLC